MASEAFRDFESPEDENPIDGLIDLFEFEAQLPPEQPSFDWRENGLTFRVRDQGGWNACTSFAMVAMVEARRTLAGVGNDRLIASDIHCCLAGRTNPLTPLNPRRAGEFAAEHGIARGPVDPLPPAPQECANFAPSRLPIPASDYAFVQGSAILNLLARDGPLLADMYVPRSFHTLGAHDLYVPEDTPDPVLHSMCLVGYDFDARHAVLLNSMGTAWGNGGYLTVPFGTGGLLQRFPYAIDFP